MKSIIPQDPLRPIDESLLSYRDEVDDAKVRNLVHLISVNRVFSKEMFRGGATKLEVEMMRDKSKASGKKKMGKEVPSSSRCMEQSQIISVLTSLLKPEMERIDDRVTAALASVEQMSASALSYQASVVSVVEGMLKNLKDDILTSLRLSRAVPFMEQVNSACNSANMNNARTISNTPNPINTMIAPARPPTTNPFITPPRHKTVNRVVSGNLDKAQLRENNNNEVVIMNVLENLSHYSTPPKSAERCQVCAFSSNYLHRTQLSWNIYCMKYIIINNIIIMLLFYVISSTYMADHYENYYICVRFPIEDHSVTIPIGFVHLINWTTMMKVPPFRLTAI